MAQRAAAKNATVAMVTNSRGVAVTGLQITSAAGKVVASIKAPLAAGKNATLKIPARSGCTFTVNAAFADEAEFDQTEVDLCADKNIRFTD